MNHSQAGLQPRNFKPAGKVYEARLCKKPPFIKPPGRGSKAQAQGRRYERKIQEFMLAEYPDFYVPGPWFNFNYSNSSRWCQADGLLVELRRGLVTVIEIKLKHCELAWWQLNTLYLPVVQKAFGPSFQYRILEIVKWYDPTTRTPERVTMCADPLQARNFAVHIIRR